MGQIVGSIYQMIKKIGSGGGGNVYLAVHLRLGKKVVLKADKRKITTRPELLRREVDILKNLRHSYIPQVYDFFEENGMVYTVMDFIEGESLDKPLKRGERFTQAQVIHWAVQILEALCYLHSPTHGDPPRGYVHSDIKPGNLMRTPGNDICLIDFNIALALGEENVVGRSAGYSSPEYYGLDYSAVNRERRQINSKKNGKAEQCRSDFADTEETEVKTEDSIDTVTILDNKGKKDEDRLTENVFDPAGWSGSYTGFSEQEGLDSAALCQSMIHSKSLSQSSQQSGTVYRKFTPDVRSDIYSVGATLYHLLSGVRPAVYPKKVEPLSEKEFSPQVVRIISRAMSMNPEERYQSAEEMLYDFTHLRENDPRTKRMKLRNRIVYSVTAAVFFIGIGSAFVGLKRIQAEESGLKLAEYSQNALADGDVEDALRYALDALPEKTNIITPEGPAQAQKALTDALGVYDLSDGYKKYGTAELEKNPLYLTAAPDGTTAVCIYEGAAAVIDLQTLQVTATLPTVDSAMAEAEYLDSDTVIYAGENGVTAYSISEGRQLWYGEPATAISVAHSGNLVAAVYGDESRAVIYDALTGEKTEEIDFGDKKQNVTMVSENFANPENNLFEINDAGTLLAVSFADGSLELYDLPVSSKVSSDSSEASSDGSEVSFDGSEKSGEGGEAEAGSAEPLEILDELSGYTHFSGGFYGNYLAFSAANGENSVFAVIDGEKKQQTIGLQSDSTFHVQTDENGIYVQVKNILVKIDPVTGEQTTLVTTDDSIRQFAVGAEQTAVITQDKILFFDKNAQPASEMEETGASTLLASAGDLVLYGQIDTPVLRVLKYRESAETPVLDYDPSIEHDEARISDDGQTVMLFSYKGFSICDMTGKELIQTVLPDPAAVFDQQFIREDGQSCLEVTYRDGRLLTFDAADGTLISEETVEAPDMELDEVFYTDDYRIEAPLHGAPQVYDAGSGEKICELDEDAFLTYVTQTGDYIIAQYITAEGFCYGILMDRNCRTLAELPYLCDIADGELYFDYPSGSIRKSEIYELDELVDMAEKELESGD